MTNCNTPFITCVDLGGTKLAIANIADGKIIKSHTVPIDASLTKDDFNAFLFNNLTPFVTKACRGICIGVPGLVESDSGFVIEVLNIKHWQNVALKTLLEARFARPVLVHNDANCFTYGIYKSKDYQGYENLVGVTLGTGLGAGLILNGRLYTGKQSAAGEFGSFPYLDGIIEDYCSSQFFKKQGLDGAATYQQAQAGDNHALALFTELGKHLGHALVQVVHAFNPEKVVFGGAIAKSAPLFIDALQQTLLKQLPQSVYNALQIHYTQDTNTALFGAYQLFLDEVATGE
ncbi:ROK family protein [Pseudoalteromonas sp. MMG024]|uniref:ROK family protein n=1 Tax=Pseudoalteromonas sp. MMG024 TaxID=2909980 RepID=UPI001F37CEE1|nr:ROK family protein [Pseudoalteromonas sp. MMG024]MCF6455797.1 ROK family protein [Pseudoalteromonas sp. MMG024]